MRARQSQIPKGLIVSLVVLQVALGLLLSQFYLSSHNSLYNNGNWSVTKTQLWNGLMGSYAYLFDLQPLARGSLNLAAWHGYQEVFLQQEVDPASVEFDLYLHKQTSYLTFLFDRAGKSYSGIRLGRNKRYPPAILKISDDGRFLSKKTFRVRRLKLHQWNHFKVEFGDGEISTFLNGRLLGTFESRSVGPQRIGFRGGMDPVFIDNVLIAFRDGSSFRETFNRPRNWLFVSGIAIAGVVLLAWSLFFVLRRVVAMSDKHLLFFMLMFTGVLLATGGAVLGLFSYKKGFYPNASEKLKQQEAYWKDASAEKLFSRIEERYPRHPDPNTHRIIFLGSSQTAGAGARSEEESLVWRTEELLNQRSSNLRYECINAAVRGYVSREMEKDFRERWVNWSPSTLIINASHNDRSVPERFRKHLTLIIERARRAGIQVVLIQEPNTGEIANHFLLLGMHDIMTEVARVHGVPVIDMHGYLAGKQDEGFLWWDGVHMTSAGQSYFAEHLVDELDRLGVVALDVPSGS